MPANGYTIPQGTPFALAGTGTDPDNDALAYSWEQLDRGTTTALASAAADASGPPLFRSLAPTGSPARTFPALASILSGSNPLANGEILPLVARTLNFRLTAHDSRGGVAGANLNRPWPPPARLPSRAPRRPSPPRPAAPTPLPGA